MDFFKSERQNISIKNNKTTKITYLKKNKNYILRLIIL